MNKPHVNYVNKSDLATVLAASTPAAIFCQRLADFSDAIEFVKSIGKTAVTFEKQHRGFSEMATMIDNSKPELGEVFLLTSGWIHGWHSSALRCIVMWGSDWSDVELLQAWGRSTDVRCGLLITRTAI